MRELVILNEIARALNTSVDLAAALEVALERGGALFDLETGWVWLLNEESGEPYLAAARNLPPALAANPALMEGYCWCLDSYRSGELTDAANINVITRLAIC
jgi:two-component system, NarL family, sensor kinase